MRTRVFGIGFQRTGTSSLAAACGLLGWRCKHGDYRRFPGSLDLEDDVYQQYDMFCDTPYFHLFEKLDHRFPGSKFVLTRRPVDRWVESLRWLYRKNDDWRARLEMRMHQTVIFGSSVFDESLMRSVYDAHHRRVVDHFRASREQLLEVDVCAGDGWEKLCPFLGVPCPDVPFPHCNARSE